MIAIELKSNASRIVRQFETLPRRFLEAIRGAVDDANQGTLAHILRKRYTSGRGPFPVSEGKLGRRSGQLRESLYVRPARISGSAVVSAIGTPVKYAGVHEFGFTGQVNVPAHTRTIQNRSVAVRAYSYQASIPARAPLRNGIEDRLNQYSNTISRAIVREWKSGGAT